jgi:hypothetical protein
MNSLFKFLFLILSSQAGEVTDPVLGGDDPAPTDDPGNVLGGNDPDPTPAPADPNPAPTMNPILKEMYGDLADKIEWPEGLEDDIKTSPSVRPFIGKDGKINYPALAKSYVHTKSKVGAQGVQVPSDTSPQEEWDEYFEKVGWTREIEGYTLKAPEGTELTEDTLKAITTKLHDARIPPKQAQKVLESLHELTKTGLDTSVEKMQQEIAEGINGLKKEWGAAFDQKVGLAKKVISSFGDEGIKQMVKEDPSLGSNPAFIKFLHNIGNKFYGEDGIPGKGMGDYALSPTEASEQINMILGNMDDPYHKPSHPSYNDRVKHVQKLFSYKHTR